MQSGQESDRVMRNRIESLELNKMSGVSEMDLAKFHMTWYILTKFLLDVILKYPLFIFKFMWLLDLGPFFISLLITYFISSFLI